MVYSEYSVSAIAVSVVLPLLAAAAVFARVKSRRIKSVPLAADDYLIVVALAIAIAEGIFCIWGSLHAGIGAKIQNLSPSVFTKLAKSLFVVVLIHLTVLAVIKTSILLFYKRIFVTPKFQTAASVLIGVVICWWITFFVGPFFVTTPLHNFWTSPTPEYNFDWPVFVEILAALDIAVDVIILCLPIPMIKTLHMGTRRKVQLMGIFWLGLFCVVSAAVRMYYVVAFNDIGPLSPDITRIIDNNFIWAQIEPCTSIIAACLPTFGPLFQSWRSPESIVNSVRSVFSVPSSRSARSVYRSDGPSTTNKDNQDSETNSSLARRAWLELGDRGSNEARVAAGVADIELGRLNTERSRNGSSIIVEKSFTTSQSQR